MWILLDLMFVVFSLLACWYCTSRASVEDIEKSLIWELRIIYATGIGIFSIILLACDVLG